MFAIFRKQKFHFERMLGILSSKWRKNATVWISNFKQYIFCTEKFNDNLAMCLEFFEKTRRGPYERYEKFQKKKLGRSPSR